MRELKTVLEPLVDQWRQERRELLAERGEESIAEVKVKDLFRGMRGVPAVVCDTSTVDPQRGLFIRGVPVNELLNRSGEALFFLLLTGREPSTGEERVLIKELDDRAVVPQATLELVDRLSDSLHPMTTLSMATLSLQWESAFQEAHRRGVARDELWEHDLDDALRLIAVVPVIAARIYRKSLLDTAPIERPRGVGFSKAYAAMLGLPDSQGNFAEFIRQFVVVHADHEGANASVLAARVTHSTMSDLYYAQSSAMNCLAGPLHGRSNQESIQMILEIERRFGGVPSHEELRQYIGERLDAGRIIPGFGHAVLRDRDPRYDALLQMGKQLCRECGPFAIAEALEEVVTSELRARGKAASPFPNIDGISGALLHYFGMTEYAFYTVMFSVAQMLGLTAQLVLERALGAPLFRPRSIMTGDGG